jgi:hypothetical protein
MREHRLAMCDLAIRQRPAAEIPGQIERPRAGSIRQPSCRAFRAVALEAERASVPLAAGLAGAAHISGFVGGVKRHPYPPRPSSAAGVTGEVTPSAVRECGGAGVR